MGLGGVGGNAPPQPVTPVQTKQAPGPVVEEAPQGQQAPAAGAAAPPADGARVQQRPQSEAVGTGDEFGDLKAAAEPVAAGMEQLIADTAKQLQQLKEELAKMPPLKLVDNYRQNALKEIDVALQALDKLKSTTDVKEAKQLANLLQNGSKGQAGIIRPLEKPRETKEYSAAIDRFEQLRQAVADQVWERIQ